MSRQESMAAPQTSMLLTSAGITTNVVKNALQNTLLADTSGTARVLQFTDAWPQFPHNSQVMPYERREQFITGWALRRWSQRCLQWAMEGDVQTMAVEAGSTKSDDLKRLLDATDVVEFPGGNTFQFLSAVEDHRWLIKDYVEQGAVKVIATSAGTIGCGMTGEPMLIKPADVVPGEARLPVGLALFYGDIMVHAPGGSDHTDMPLPRRWRQGFQWTLAMSESSQEARNAFLDKSSPELPHYALRDDQALLVTQGKVQTLGGSDPVIAFSAPA